MAQELRLVGENVEIGVYSLNKALALAESLELDLVEVSTETLKQTNKEKHAS